LNGGQEIASDPDCIFCKIASGVAPSFKVYEDDQALAFMDINPFNEGHALAIPKAHFINLLDVSEDAMSATINAAQRAARAIEKRISPDGINLIQANGPGAAQSVMHFHIHILPRKFGDEAPINWGLRPGNQAVIADLAEMLMGANE
jgi:histidine triad (HIT) family protein